MGLGVSETHWPWTTASPTASTSTACYRPTGRPLHERILKATAEQIRSYERFMRAKAQNPSLDLRNMLGDPSLSSAAIELRFCGFDAL
jgi:hypothetical protein